MIAAHDSLPILDFEEPEGIVHADVCLESGELATDRCSDVRAEVYIEGTEPTAACHIHPSAGRYDPASARKKDNLVPEDTTDERASDKIMSLHQIPGVLTVTLTYHHFEDIAPEGAASVSSHT
jgi:membrane carboxypeptidase/penicillin-binding protein